MTTRSARPPTTLAIFLLVLLAFTDEVASFAKWLASTRDWTAKTGQVIEALTLGSLDLVILALVFWQRRRIRLASGRHKARIVTFWWLGGATLMGLADAYWLNLVVPSVLREGIAKDLLLAVVCAVALVILVAATIGANPLMLVSRRLRVDTDGWEGLRAAIPLLIGILFAYLAAVWWDVHLEPSSAHADPKENSSTVNVQFFAQASQVLPLLIVALGYEIGTFRKAMATTTQRAAAVVSLTFLCLGEVLALSVLVRPDNGGTSFNWHTYSAFVVVVTAGLIGLTTLLGALLAESRERTQKDEPPKEPEPAPATERGWHHAVAIGVLTTAVVAFVLRRRG